MQKREEKYDKLKWPTESFFAVVMAMEMMARKYIGRWKLLQEDSLVHVIYDIRGSKGLFEQFCSAVAVNAPELCSNEQLMRRVWSDITVKYIHMRQAELLRNFADEKDGDGRAAPTLRTKVRVSTGMVFLCTLFLAALFYFYP
jgi:hypothetical protein